MCQYNYVMILYSKRSINTYQYSFSPSYNYNLINVKYNLNTNIHSSHLYLIYILYISSGIYDIFFQSNLKGLYNMI